ncbi:DNA helicase [Caerostris extrusa]|uniref:DNA helicase n=1 Tax=Caerostris extrusa TaxID=172846 RepID=A0AAV4WYJ7_CAEEX|nr:DNA helicase [Caerostris extrusa]
MVDDAQDCHPALLDIVTSQNLPIILIGDPNQHIYGFCGSLAIRNHLVLKAKIIGQYAIFARTYVHLFNEAYRLCVEKDLNPLSHKLYKVALQGDLKTMHLIKLLKLARWLRVNMMKSYLKYMTNSYHNLKNFEDLTTYAKNIGDSDLLTMIELVNQHGPNIEKLYTNHSRTM